jgi:hypothetical protein
LFDVVVCWFCCAVPSLLLFLLLLLLLLSVLLLLFVFGICCCCSRLSRYSFIADVAVWLLFLFGYCCLFIAVVWLILRLLTNNHNMLDKKSTLIWVLKSKSCAGALL